MIQLLRRGFVQNYLQHSTGFEIRTFPSPRPNTQLKREIQVRPTILTTSGEKKRKVHIFKEGINNITFIVK